VHEDFRGFARFVVRKKSRYKLIGNRLVIPHDIIPSNVVVHTINEISRKRKLYMNSKNKMKVIAINAILFAALFGLVSLNKEFLRPTLNNSNLLKILTGCFPNFIAAYLISLASVSAVLIRKINHGRLIVYTSSIVVFIILMIEELKPMWGASTYYDLFDIIASGMGSILTIITYELAIVIEKRQKSRKKSTYYNK
jgi:hypothetical protein